MTISRDRARELCTRDEFELVEESRGKGIDRLGPSELRARIRRARGLRDKYRALARQQSGEARGKRDPKSTRPAAGSANTELKAELFGETQERFEARLAEVED